MEQNKSKGTRVKKLIIAAVIAVILFFCLIVSLIYVGSRNAYIGQQSQAQYSNSQPTQVSDMSWHTVIAMSSSKDWNTPAFTMQGSEWRITWGCTLIDKLIGEGGFSASIASVIDNSGHNFAIGDDCTSGTSTPTYYYAEKPGRYYLKLGPTNSTYNVEVEDLY